MTQIQVEELSPVKKKVTFEIPEDRVRALLDAEYEDMRKTAQVKGFRKGKVPLTIIKTYFKERAVSETARKIIEETFEKGLEDNAIKPVHVAKLDPETVEAGKPFKYTAEIEVRPAVTMDGYKGLSLTKRIRTVSPELVDKQLEDIRQGHARLQPITEAREVVAGDHVVVDVSAEVDGEPEPSLRVLDYNLELGRDFYLPDFDKEIIGMKPEEERTATITFPEDYVAKKVAGKTATFHVVLKEAKERVLPALDDDFAKDLGPYATIGDLRAEIEKGLRAEYDGTTDRELQNAAVDAILEVNSFEVPDSLVDQEIDRLLYRSYQALAMRGIDVRRVPPPSQEHRNQARPGAIRLVKSDIVLQTIAEQEGLSVTDEELNQEIERRAAQIELSPDFLRDEIEKEGKMESLRREVLDKKTCDLILNNATITEEQVAGEEESSSENQD